MFPMKFRHLLKYFRERKDVTKAELARRVGVGDEYMINIENGNKEPCSIERCKQIATALSLTSDELNQLIYSAMMERIPEETLDWLEKNLIRTNQIPIFLEEDVIKWNVQATPIPQGNPDGFCSTTTKGDRMFGFKTGKGRRKEVWIIDPSLKPSQGNYVLVREPKKASIKIFSSKIKGEILGVAVEKNESLR